MKIFLVILFLSISIFAQEIEQITIQERQDNIMTILQGSSVSFESQRLQHQIDHYQSMRRSGMAMTITGAAFAQIGLAGFMHTITRPNNRYSSLVLPLFLLGCTGTILFTVGVPRMLVGTVRERRYKRMLPNYTHITPNGVNFSWNF